MAGFSTYSSHGPYKSEVDQILAEAMDHCVLEQVAAINCSSFSNSSLPSHLENRFHKLKSFPSSSKVSNLKQKPAGSSHREGKDGNSPSGQSKDSIFRENPGEMEGKKGNSHHGYVSSPAISSSSSKDRNFEQNEGERKVKNGKLPSEHSKDLIFEENSCSRKGKDGNSPSGYVSFSDDSLNSSPEHSEDQSFDEVKNGKLPSGQSKDENFRVKSGERRVKNGNSQHGYASSPVSSSNSSPVHTKDQTFEQNSGSRRGKKENSQPKWSDSDEETGRRGCLWCSPKRGSRKKSGSRNGGEEFGLDWGRNDDILSDLRSFSSKAQKKRMKEAMQEQEKVNKEAEKIVKWAKQVSARMEFSISDDDELSDDSFGHH